MTSRVFVVTGSARGIGLEWIKQLSKDPNNTVFAIARQPSKELLALVGPNSHVVVGEITDPASINDAAAEVASKTDRIDVLINNAGVMLEKGEPTAFIDIPIDMFAESFRINVVGTIQATKAFLPLLKKGSERKVVNISTFAGSIAHVDNLKDLMWPNSGIWGAYSVSKAALNMATRKFDANLRHEGFSFIALHPGWVKTDMGKVGPDDNKVEPSYTADMSVKDSLAIINQVTPQTANKFYAVDTEDKTLPW
ncbi:NAD(P)-binding protein [Atractiella rhizophila]|nr:NAD(P)-binding protein [Atractiella rhizophila]